MNHIIDRMYNNFHLNIDYLHEKIKGGYLTDNFSISNGKNKYFLKQYRFDDEQLIQNIHKVKYFFANNGIPVILPIKNTSGQSYFIFDNKIYALFPFINATIIPRSDQTTETLKSLTLMLSRIHLISKDGGFPLITNEKMGWDLEKFYLYADEYLSIIKNKSNDDFDIAAKRHIELKLKLSENIQGNFEDLCLKNDHLLHGDYHECNVFYDNKSNISHVFDLEKTVIGPRVSELIRMIDYVIFDNQYNKTTYARAKIVFDTYQSKYPLSLDQWHDGLLAYFYKDFSNLWILKKHYIEKNYRPDFFLYNSLKGDEYISEYFDDHFKRLLSFYSKDQ